MHIRTASLADAAALAAVEADYEKVSDELSHAQLALDAVNQRDTFELTE